MVGAGGLVVVTLSAYFGRLHILFCFPAILVGLGERVKYLKYECSNTRLPVRLCGRAES